VGKKKQKQKKRKKNKNVIKKERRNMNFWRLTGITCGDSIPYDVQRYIVNFDGEVMVC
jgi:hypothetical protein